MVLITVPIGRKPSFVVRKVCRAVESGTETLAIAALALKIKTSLVGFISPTDVVSAVGRVHEQYRSK